MKLNVNGIHIEEEVTEQVLEKYLLSLPGGDEDSFLILEKSELTYMQVSGKLSEGVILEYQEGSVSEHYLCSNIPLKGIQVIAVFKNYLSGSESWKSLLTWEKEKLEATSSFISTPLMVLALLGFLGCWFWWSAVI